MKFQKRHLISLLTYGTISVLIGVAFIAVLNPKALQNPMVWVRNAGYSLMLGTGLFLAGRLFTSIESRYLSWLKRPVQSIAITLATSMLYSSAVIFFTNWFWYIFLRRIAWSDFWEWGSIIIAYEYVVFYAISLIMFAKSFFREWRINAIEKEKLRHEALALQYETLSNQVNPHFLFNSLNVLLSLIDHDTDAAKRFTRQLAAFYRQLLSFKDQPLIPLDQEIELMRNYLDLLQIRFGDALRVSIDCHEGQNRYIIPLTLQLLVENAMKHNAISHDRPLHLAINCQHNQLVVSNTLQKKSFVAEPSRIGLKNLNDRYKFLTNNAIEISDANDQFVVRIPLIDSLT